MKFAYLTAASLFAAATIASADECMSLPAIASVLEGSYCSALPPNPWGVSGDAVVTIGADRFTLDGYNLQGAPTGLNNITMDGCVKSVTRQDVPSTLAVVDVTYTLSNPLFGTVGPVCTTFTATGSMFDPTVRLLSLDNTNCVAPADATRTEDTDHIKVIAAVQVSAAAAEVRQCSGAGAWTLSVGGLMMVVAAVMKGLRKDE